MSTTEKAVTYTPGAMRAAKKIALSDKIRQLALGIILRQTFADDIAGIISRETGDAELLETLERGHRYFLQSNDLSPDDRDMLDEMWAAIRKAKGEAL